MLHQGLRVCEECRRVGVGVGGAVRPHKRLPQGEEGRGWVEVGVAVRHGDAAAQGILPARIPALMLHIPPGPQWRRIC